MTQLGQTCSQRGQGWCFVLNLKGNFTELAQKCHCHLEFMLLVNPGTVLSLVRSKHENRIQHTSTEFKSANTQQEKIHLTMHKGK